MENSLIGAITSGVVCGVLFCITIAIVCYLCYRCRRHEDEKSSQHDPLINGHIPNGVIPTVTQLVPLPAHSPSRRLYQFPTMPTRHVANYRPRYIEEVNPQGMPKAQGHSVVMKSQTYNGPYVTPKGPVFYDVRQHGGYRSNRSPVWAHKSQEESVATMTLGEESPILSDRHFVLEENNNRTSVKSDSEHITVEKRSSRTEDLRIPSPDASRRSYLFTVDTELEPASQSSSQPANDKTHDIYTTPGEPADDVRRGETKVTRVLSRRQRRGEDGALNGGVVPPKHRPRSHLHREDPTPQDFDGAVYIFSATPQTILEDHQDQPHQQPQQQPYQQPQEQPHEQPIERYFINDDMYTVSTKSTKESPVLNDTSSSQTGLRVYGRPAEDMNHVMSVPQDVMHEQSDSASQPPRGNYVQGEPVRPLTEELDNLQRGTSIGQEPHHIDYRVIKSKRRPSWLQNAGQWFFKGKKNK